MTLSAVTHPGGAPLPAPSDGSHIITHVLSSFNSVGNELAAIRAAKEELQAQQLAESEANRAAAERRADRLEEERAVAVEQHRLAIEELGRHHRLAIEEFGRHHREEVDSLRSKLRKVKVANMRHRRQVKRINNRIVDSSWFVPLKRLRLLDYYDMDEDMAAGEEEEEASD